MSPNADVVHRRPLSMIARIAAVLVIAVLLELLGSLALERLSHRNLVSDDRFRDIATELGTARVVATETSRPLRSRAMHRLSSSDLRLNWVPATVITDATAVNDGLVRVRALLTQGPSSLPTSRLRLSLLPSDQAGKRDLIGALALEDGSFVTFRVAPFLAAPPSPVAIVALHMLFTAAVLTFALVMIRSLTRPLRQLALAADATGSGTASFAVPQDGPHEVQRVAAAFRGMQHRLVQMVDDHTHALVAVSHDLRTPIQRLRLRSALLEDEDARSAIADDLTEMERFIDSTLAYVRSGEDEALRQIDLSALIATIADDASDLGADISTALPDSLLLETRPTGLTRSLTNIIDNGRRHAASLHVALDRQQEVGDHWVVITIDDDGPGIPADQRETALLPFRRLDQRTGCAGGAGLGLSTAQRIISGLGGRLRLDQSPAGGLRVRILLPAPLDS